MQARIENPTTSFPGALQALLKLHASVDAAGILKTTRYFIEARASQL